MTDPLELLGLDLVIPEQERDLQALVRRMLDERVRPHVAEWFEHGRVPQPRELAREFGAIGLLGMHLRGYGCAGTSALGYGLACLELEAVDSGVRSLVSVQGSLAMHSIVAFGSDEQKDEWLPRMATGEAIGCFGLTEPDFGSNPAGMHTVARRVTSGESAAGQRGDWELSGTKLWITNAPFADVATIWARTEEGIAGFLVPLDSPGVTVNTVHHKLSLRASATGEIALQEVRLPDAARLPQARGLRAPLSCLDEARFGIAFGAVGAARDALQTTIDYAMTREVFDRPLAAYQLTQGKLADMTVDLHRTLLLAVHLAALKDAGRITPEQVSLGKLASTRTAIAIARECRTILGASGITTEYSPMRHANNLESVLTYEGTEEMHQLTIGKALTGFAAFR